MPKETPEIVNNLVIPSCRGVADLDRLENEEVADNIKGPVLPPGEEVSALVTIFSDNTRAICCPLAREGHKAGQVNCNAVRYDDSPWGSKYMAGKESKGWRVAKVGTACIFEKPVNNT